MDGKLLLRIGGGVTLACGTITLLLPQIAANLTDLEPVSNDGWSELRAVFGGLFLVMGYVTLAASDSAKGRAMIRGFGLLLCGLVLGRVVSLFFDQFFNLYTWFTLAAEVALAWCYLRGVALVEQEG